MTDFSKLTVGFALTGSFCTLAAAISEMEKLKGTGADIIPIVSYSVYDFDTRFGKAASFISHIEDICGREVICTIAGAEPIGPQGLLDVLVIMPCTGNTLAKLYSGISDTPVTLAAKAHLRNSRPLLISVATNDGLSMNAKTIGSLMNINNIYFLPLSQDDCIKKENSIIAEQSNLIPCMEYALCGKKLQPQLY